MGAEAECFTKSDEGRRGPGRLDPDIFPDPGEGVGGHRQERKPKSFVGFRI